MIICFSYVNLLPYFFFFLKILIFFLNLIFHFFLLSLIIIKIYNTVRWQILERSKKKRNNFFYIKNHKVRSHSSKYALKRICFTFWIIFYTTPYLTNVFEPYRIEREKNNPKLFFFIFVWIIIIIKL
jgi:hypothetical protein